MIHLPDRTKANARTAFSLIEVLVATTLLILIVITVGTIFRQSSLSWDSGQQRADGSMLVRSVIGALERDLRAAVDGRSFPGVDADLAASAMAISSSAAKFVALLATEDGKNREPVLVELTGGNTVTRTATPLKCGSDGNWSKDGTPSSTTLLYYEAADPYKTALSFSWKPAESPNDLPLWVTIEVELVNDENFSGIASRSMGRDGKPNTSDDIVIH